jgi:hypothetical protein
MKEGFWYSEWEPHLPMPIGSGWLGQEAKTLAAKLEAVEKWAKCEGYMGSSWCRLCPSTSPRGRMNGSHEYELDGWTWPEGLIHYIRIHNLKPSDEFIVFIERILEPTVS